MARHFFADKSEDFINAQVWKISVFSTNSEESMLLTFLYQICRQYPSTRLIAIGFHHLQVTLNVWLSFFPFCLTPYFDFILFFLQILKSFSMWKYL